jgi:class 3 adenylate cyclase
MRRASSFLELGGPVRYRSGVPTLRQKERDRLPDTAFAYVDRLGRRRLPINDEEHVRAALGRFNQVDFEDDAARERARRRLLVAAKKYGIVPIGFITNQLRAASGGPSIRLPTGFVTFLFTDIEASTGLLERLGEGYAGVLSEVRAIQRRTIRGKGGQVVDARGDEVFAVFKRAAGAAAAASAIHRSLRDRTWEDAVTVRIRAGIHAGRPTLTDGGYVGMAVHTASRVCSAAHGGQTLVTAEAVDSMTEAERAGFDLGDLGTFRLRGIARPQILFQSGSPDGTAPFPPPRDAA